MQKVRGDAQRLGKIAYVPQQPFILNMTLEKNITFKNDFNQSWYRKVIISCALRDDFKQLKDTGGDQTEIGKKGINLSGGQKQRVALARAVYESADLYIFDDPLSAVDAHVGKHIFDKVLSYDCGILREKTRLLVTNAMQYVSSCDRIIVMKEGYIIANGSYEELIGRFQTILVPCSQTTTVRTCTRYQAFTP